MISERNIVNVCKEDKDFICTITKLTPDKKTLVKGIIIGLQLQEQSNNETKVI